MYSTNEKQGNLVNKNKESYLRSFRSGQVSTEGQVKNRQHTLRYPDKKKNGKSKTKKEWQTLKVDFLKILKNNFFIKKKR